jgi:general secretion pathway protein G
MRKGGTNESRRGRTRGVTLIEVAVVVAIMTLISPAVGVAVLDRKKEVNKKIALTALRSIRRVAQSWQAEKSEAECPTISPLLDDRYLDDAAPVKEPWGGTYRIFCNDGVVGTTSARPDRREGPQTT